MADQTADYVRIRQQLVAFRRIRPGWPPWKRPCPGRGFAVQRVTDMDGWLANHAAFVACVVAALVRCGVDPSAWPRTRRPDPDVPGHYRGLSPPAR